MPKTSKKDKINSNAPITGSTGISGTTGSDGLKGTEPLFPYFDERNDKKHKK